MSFEPLKPRTSSALHYHAFILGRQCSVCMEPLDGTSDMSAAHCGHVFHAHCLLQWLGSKDEPTCPTCRQPIDAETGVVRKLYFVAGFDGEGDGQSATLRGGTEAVECERKMWKLESEKLELYERLTQSERQVQKMGFDNSQLAVEARNLAVENVNLSAQLEYMNDLKGAMESDLQCQYNACQQLQANLQQLNSKNSALVATCERQSEHINRLEAGSLFHQPYLASLLAGPGIHGSQNSSDSNSRCLLLRGLSSQTEETTLCDIFLQFGPVDRVQIVYGAFGVASGIAFVCMQHPKHARLAKEAMCGGITIDNRSLTLEYANEKDHVHQTLLTFKVPPKLRKYMVPGRSLFHPAGSPIPD